MKKNKKNILLFAVCTVCLLFCVGELIDLDLDSTNGGINMSSKSRIEYPRVNKGFDMRYTPEMNSRVVSQRKNVSGNKVSAKIPSLKSPKNVSSYGFSRQSAQKGQHRTITLHNSSPNYNMRTRSVNNQYGSNSNIMNSTSMFNNGMFAMNTFDESTAMQTRVLPEYNDEPTSSVPIGSDYALLLFVLLYVVAKKRMI